MLKFSNPYIFWFLFGVIFILGLAILRYIWRRQKIKKYFAVKNLSSVLPDLSFGRWMFRYVMVSVIFMLIVLTLTRPKFGPKVRMTKSTGIDIVLAIDVSTSMLCQDIKPNRLESTKDAVAAFLEKLKGDRVGLVAFAGQADLLVEMTNDYAAIRNMLSGVNPAMFGTQGTSISEAIEVSLKAFPNKMNTAGAIILLTDGEDHEGALDEMIAKANKKGINIFTIGIGTNAGGPIPMYDGQGILRGYKQDNNNQEVITRANPQLLEDIARKGKGTYYKGEDPLTALMDINKELRKLEKETFESKNEEGLEEQFQWILIFVIILLLVELFYTDKKGKLLKKIDV
jgi:Ca-activated chloride channel family protein